MNGLKALTFEIVLSINKNKNEIIIKCVEISRYLYF
jgi:hypothetical protein